MTEAAGGQLPDETRARVLDRLPDGICLTDAEGVIVYVNPALLGQLGHQAGAVVGTNIVEHVHPDDIAYMLWSWENRLSHPGEPGLVVHGRARHADGTWRAFEVLGLSLQHLPDTPYMVVSTRDLSRQAALADSPARLRSMIDRTTDVVLLLDGDGRFVFANRRLTSRYGHDNDRVVGRPWTSILHRDDVEAADAWFERLRHPDSSPQVSVRLRVRDLQGEFHDVEWNGTNQMDDPVIGGIIVGGRDVTNLVTLERQLLEQNAKLHHAATHDPLTGLLNRPAFVAAVEEHLHARRMAGGRGDAVLLFCDLDSFKAVNDRLGHRVGDSVLVTVAERLRANVRDGDVVGRYGGDEFTVLLGAPASPLGVSGLAERLRGSLTEPISLGGEAATIGMTVGVSRAPVATADVDGLLHDADAAMYAQKRTRR